MASEVRIPITATDKASKPIKEVRGALDGLSKSSGLSVIKSGFFLGVGMRIADAALSHLASALGGFATRAVEGEVAATKLDAAFRTQGTTLAANAAEVEKSIAAGIRLGFTDDEQTDSLARLVIATGDLATAQRFQAAAMDLARTKGISLADATAAMTKVEAGQYRALKDLGIILPKGATAMDALAAVEAKTAGQAEAFADTTAGAAAKVNAGWDQMQEKLGTALLPVMSAFSTILADDVIPALSEAFAGVLPQVTDAFKQFGGWLRANGPAIKAILTQAFKAIGDAISWVAVNVLPKLADAFKWFVDNVMPRLAAVAAWIAKDVLPALATALQWIGDNVLPALAKAWDWISKEVLPPVTKALRALIDDVLPGLAKAFDWITTNILPAWAAAWGTIFGIVGPIIGAITGLIQKAIDAQLWLLELLGQGTKVKAGSPPAGFGGTKPPHGAEPQAFALGTNYVPQNMLAYLHRGEAVIPAAQNHPGARGGVTVNVGGVTLNGIGNSVTPAAARRFGQAVTDAIADALQQQGSRFSEYSGARP